MNESSIILHYFKDTCAVYNKTSADVFLLSHFNAELLTLMKSDVSEQMLIIKMAEHYQLNTADADVALKNLINEYQNLGFLIE